MARPCGCSSGGCNARGVDGIEVTGTCGINDPLTIGLADNLGAGCEPVMDCVGGNLESGLAYNDDLGHISVRISGDAGNQASFGSDGGVFASGMPDPGIGGVTVASLPAENVLGGTYGAGFTQWPEATIQAYEQAMLIPHLHMVHVPARRSAEMLIHAVRQRQPILYDAPVSNRQRIDNQDTKEAANTLIRPSGAPAANGTYNPLDGYFGFGFPEKLGMPTMQDVFNVTARRKVLYIQNLDIGGSNDTFNPLATIAQTGRLVTSWGLQKSVIVGSEIPPTLADPDSIRQGLSYIKDLGIETAAHIPNNDHAVANPAADLVALRCTWVFCGYAVSSTHINEYKAAGLQVMMFNADRQEHWGIQRTLGVRGALSSDPVYTAAPTYGYRYRLINPPATDPHPWNSLVSAADYGRVGYSGSPEGAHAKFRGYTASSAVDALQFPVDAVPPPNSSYLVPPGRWCPIYDPDNPNPPIGTPGAPTNYDIQLGVSATTMNGGTGQAMGLFFGNPEDGRLFDLTGSRESTKGYSIALSISGNFVFRRYDGNPGVIDFDNPPWPSGFGALTAGTVYNIGIQVRPGTVRVGPRDAMTGPNSRLFNATTGGGDRWRGGFIWLLFYRNSAFTGTMRFHNLRVTNL